ncbi:MAG: PTS sugar transporter subunit IIA [Hyphomonas sp.]
MTSSLGTIVEGIGMIGIVVVSHGKLARELVAATEHVVGEQPCFRSISIEVEDDIEARRDQIRETAKSCDSGRGVIILTDMFGGTPSNLAMSIMSAGNIEVLSGVNLPMLIKLAEVRETLSLAEAAKVAAEAGRKYISIASELLAKTT